MWPATCGRRRGGPPALGKSPTGSHAHTELWALVCTTPLLPTSSVPDRGVQLPSFHSRERPAIFSSRDQTPNRTSSGSASSKMVVRLTVRVPATCANLGPGFDCLGLALRLYNEVTLDTEAEPGISWEGEGADELPTDGSDMVSTAIRKMGALHEVIA